MKQVYATGTLNSTTGPTSRAAIRASTTGTNPDAVQAALAFANYLPPSRDAEPQSKLPVRLSFLSTSHSGRVLTHVAPNGGTYFAHSLLDVPSGTDALTAIQTWGSPDWQRHEPEAGTDLPELPFLPVADVLDDTSMKSWLEDDSHREMLEYVFNALIVVPSSARVILAAKADDVAAVVYAVTRAFPTSLTDDFTFSTYEADPLSCRARLIGRDPGTSGTDLPDNCYRDDAFGYNPASGRKSPLPREIGFAAFAAKALTTGDVAVLDDFRGTWQRLNLSDASHFDLIDRIFRSSGEIAKHEISAVVQSPAVVQWIAGQQDTVARLLEWAIDDREFAKGTFSRIVQTIRQKPEQASKLADAVKVAGFAAVQTGETTQAGNAFDVILPMIAPAKAATVWTELLSRISNPGSLTWPMRWHLLPRLARVKMQSWSVGVPAELRSWLAVPADQLRELLALDLPKSYLNYASREAWKKRDTESLQTLTKAISADPAITLILLHPEDMTNASEKHCAELFESVLKESPDRSWFVDVIAGASDYPKSLLNRFFEADLATGRTDVDRVVRTQGETLLQLFAGQSGLDTLGSRFLASPPADLLQQKGLLEFLASLGEKDSTSQDLKERIAGVLTVRDYLDRPSFTADEMVPVADALNLTPTPLPGSARTDTFRAVTAALLQKADTDDFQLSVEAAMHHFGDTLAKGPTDFFQDLLRELRKSPDFVTHPNLVASTLAISLGAFSTNEFAGKIEGLEPDAFAIATDAAKSRKGKLLAEIDRRAADWPKEAKAKWGFLLEAVRPRGARIGRDVLCFLIGAATVGMIWGVMLIVKP